MEEEYLLSGYVGLAAGEYVGTAWIVLKNYAVSNALVNVDTR